MDEMFQEMKCGMKTNKQKTTRKKPDRSERETNKTFRNRKC